jgi:hypothetical protein
MGHSSSALEEGSNCALLLMYPKGALGFPFPVSRFALRIPGQQRATGSGKRVNGKAAAPARDYAGVIVTHGMWQKWQLPR